MKAKKRYDVITLLSPAMLVMGFLTLKAVSECLIRHYVLQICRVRFWGKLYAYVKAVYAWNIEHLLRNSSSSSTWSSSQLCSSRCKCFSLSLDCNCLSISLSQATVHPRIPAPRMEPPLCRQESWPGPTLYTFLTLSVHHMQQLK